MIYFKFNRLVRFHPTAKDGSAEPRLRGLSRSQDCKILCIWHLPTYHLNGPNRNNLASLDIRFTPDANIYILSPFWKPRLIFCKFLQKHQKQPIGCDYKLFQLASSLYQIQMGNCSRLPQTHLQSSLKLA